MLKDIRNWYVISKRKKNTLLALMVKEGFIHSFTHSLIHQLVDST